MIGRRSVVNGFVSERILKGGFHFITPDNRQSGHGPVAAGLQRAQTQSQTWISNMPKSGWFGFPMIATTHRRGMVVSGHCSPFDLS